MTLRVTDNACVGLDVPHTSAEIWRATYGLCFRSPDHVQLVILGDEPLFFAARDDPWLPTLRLLHKYPLMMNRLRVDTGAIKFVLSGANIMCPGLTSPGATIHNEVFSSWPKQSTFVL